MGNVFKTDRLSKFRLNGHQYTYEVILPYGNEHLFKVEFPEIYSDVFNSLISFDYVNSNPGASHTREYLGGREVIMVGLNQGPSLKITFRPDPISFVHHFNCLFNVFENSEKHNIVLYTYNLYGELIQAQIFHGCLISCLTSIANESDVEDIFVELVTDYTTTTIS